MKLLFLPATTLLSLAAHAATVSVGPTTAAQAEAMNLQLKLEVGVAVTSSAASQSALTVTTAPPQFALIGGATVSSEGGAADVLSPLTGGAVRPATRPTYEQKKVESIKRKPAASSVPPVRTARTPSVSRTPRPRVADPKGGYLGVPDDFVTEDDPGLLQLPHRSPFVVILEGGYQSKYVYHGIDVVQQAAFDFAGYDGNNAAIDNLGHDTDIWYAGAGVQWAGFSLSAKYVQSLEEFTPFYLPGPVIPEVPSEKAYEEWWFDFNYTLGILDGGLLDATAGVELRYFEEEGWWNTDLVYAFYARLKSNKNPFFRPSVTYYNKNTPDVQNDPARTEVPGNEVLSGEEFVFQIDGEVTIGEYGPVTVGATYYAELGYYLDNQGDFGLDSWGQYGGGVSLPVSFRGLTVSPSVHYHDNFHDLNQDFGEEDVIPEFWWGINAAFSF